MIFYCNVLRLHKKCKPTHVSGIVKCNWNQVHSIGHHTQNHQCPRPGGSVTHSIHEAPMFKMSIIREGKVLCVQITQAVSLLRLSRPTFCTDSALSFHLICPTSITQTARTMDCWLRNFLYAPLISSSCSPKHPQSMFFTWTERPRFTTVSDLHNAFKQITKFHMARSNDSSNRKLHTQISCSRHSADESINIYNLTNAESYKKQAIRKRTSGAYDHLRVP
jgi:hypothetical protein